MIMTQGETLKNHTYISNMLMKAIRIVNKDFFVDLRKCFVEFLIAVDQKTNLGRVGFMGANIV